ITIGREEGVDLIIQDRSISRKHLKIDFEDGKIFISDMGSSNGTYVDNQKIAVKTEVSADTHIRAGKITIQVIPPEVKKVNLDGLLKKSSKKQDEEVPELTLSKIAFEVEAAIAKAELKTPDQVHDTEEIYSMVNKDFIKDMTRQHESSTKYPSKKIESLVLWNEQIYKVQEFGYHDTISVGPGYEDSIHIPSVPLRWSLSKYDFQEAVFQVPKNLNVFAIRGQHFLSKQQLMAEKRIKENQNSLQIQISHYDVLRIEIDAHTQLYFRYVPSAVELDTKKMFNPDIYVKKALKTSFFVHLIIAVLMMLIPAEKIKTPPKKAPDRVAKLIVEAPPVVIPPPVIEPPKEEPPPAPPEEKKEEPPPPPPVKKVEPPKPKPKKEPPPKKEPIPEPEPKPEPVVVKVPPKPISKPIVQEQVVQKPAGNPKADNKPSAPAPQNAPVAVKPTPAPPAPPPPKPVDISKLGALAAMSGLKLDTKSNKPVPTNVNIAANTNTNTGAEVGTSSITSALKSQTAGLAQSNSSNASGPIKTKGNSTGSGYGTAGLGTGTGQRGVKGGVVGKPAISSGSGNGRTEGLSREQVLKSMQPYLSKIQSCYERSLLSDPNLSGRIEFEWKITSGGSVANVDIKKNSVAGGEQLGDCVSGVIRSIKFPSASNGEETNPSVGFPFGRL
ncbi:MAG: AgmX/PglI C-terminal domain-containing protein, partial [Pseudobdellovibrio sp.]